MLIPCEVTSQLFLQPRSACYIAKYLRNVQKCNYLRTTIFPSKFASNWPVGSKVFGRREKREGTSEHTSNVTGAQPRNNRLSIENQEYTGNQEYMGNKAKFRFGGCRMETEKA